MLNRFRNVVQNVMGGIAAIPHPTEEAQDMDNLQLKFAYNRAGFLKLNPDEVQVSADHSARPIIVPRKISNLIWHSGYAEVINAGKSKYNEDQACAMTLYIRKSSRMPSNNHVDNSPSQPSGNHLNTPTARENVKTDCDGCVPAVYFAIFDGHAGTGAALMAVNLLHKHIKEKLEDVIDLILAKKSGTEIDNHRRAPSSPKIGMLKKEIDADSLIIGALEVAFCEMDEQIARERTSFRITGGCTALVALFFLGKLYVVNAGDCRAIMIKDGKCTQMSFDFTPESERKRIQYVAYLQPELLHNEFTHLEFQKRIHKKDIGKQMLYRDVHMSGWAYKTVTDDDLKFPLVYGEGKRTRVLATIGVTRGFGDHDLKVHDSDIYIKPFLTPMPEVKIYDFTDKEFTEDDVLIMGSDGLWDVQSNKEVTDLIKSNLSHFNKDDKSRYTHVAQELVMNSRGMLKGRSWRTPNDKPASGDDITAFVIPLQNYAATYAKKTTGRQQYSSSERR